MITYDTLKKAFSGHGVSEASILRASRVAPLAEKLAEMVVAKTSSQSDVTMITAALALVEIAKQLKVAPPDFVGVVAFTAAAIAKVVEEESNKE